MKEFSFYISAENYTYSFKMQNEYRGGQEFIVKKGNDPLRHPDFQFSQQGPIINADLMTPIEEFEADFNNFVNRLNRLGRPLEGQLLAKVLEDIVEEHISQYGRLLINDMLSYLDLYIHINHAIFSSELSVYQDIYRFGVLRILRKFPNKVLVQTPFGVVPFQYE